MALKTRYLFIFVFMFVAVTFAGSQLAAALGVYAKGTTGVDVSYPNCTASIPKASFGVVGVTHGLLYSYNGCLASEAQHFSNLSLYVNTGWYDQSSHIDSSTPRACSANDANCLAYNYGYNGTVDAITYANGQGITSQTWWLDVESANSWGSDPIQNRNSLQGAYDALKDNHISTVGVYSTSAQWQNITNGWKNGWPNWGASTWKTPKQAAKFCTGHEFTSGPTYLIQYIGRSLDQDVAC